ncbi:MULTISPECIES: winged helix-turn-helix domain-containing protein [unclassified Streptomyces]|uniref:winged helix-turn-helix domain-containing protein n=1 Tax=unclassified Streptomyces TaxID=2593676 RepID=UPI0037F3F7E2
MRRSRGRWVCVPRVCGVGGGCGSKRCFGPAATGSHRTAAQAGRHTGRDGPGCVGARCPGSWFRGRPVDPGTSRRGRHPGNGGGAVEGVGVAAAAGRLGWSLQRPERRAIERNESEIARWIAHEWPRIKKGP